MKKICFIIITCIACSPLFAQNAVTDSVSMVTVNKDPRLELLGKAQVDINKMATRFAKGYRLFVLKSDNRDYAMKVRSYLLQNYPEEKVIMTYQSPFIKMKFGDFVEKKDAEKCRDQILKGGVITGGVYVIPDTIELKPDKTEQNEQ